MPASSKLIIKRPARFGNARFGASRFGFVTPDMDSKEAGGIGQFPYYKHREEAETDFGVDGGHMEEIP